MNISYKHYINTLKILTKTLILPVFSQKSIDLDLKVQMNIRNLKILNFTPPVSKVYNLQTMLNRMPAMHRDIFRLKLAKNKHLIEYLLPW